MTSVAIIATRAISPKALEIKAAVLKDNPNIEVLFESLDILAKETNLSDLKIELFNATRALEKKGAVAIAYADTEVASFLKELQTECKAHLFASETSNYEALACELLDAADKPLLPKGYKIGLIGGLGPAATVDLYDKIVKATPAKTDQEHIKLVVEQNPQIPDRTAALLSGGVDPTLALYNCAKRLEEDGCDAIIIPCNTAHAFIEPMKRHLTIPFINMQQTALEEIQAKFGDKARVGLMATTGTVQTGIYSKKAESMGVPLFVPDEENQKFVMSAIYGEKGVKAGFTDGICREELLKAAAYLVSEKDCNVLILGCTELPLILTEGPLTVAGKEVFIVDPTSALARKVVSLAVAANEKNGVR